MKSSGTLAVVTGGGSGIGAATARARITGKSAVALSQHGMVAPVTIHHRVDFAASMIEPAMMGSNACPSQKLALYGAMVSSTAVCKAIVRLKL